MSHPFHTSHYVYPVSHSFTAWHIYLTLSHTVSLCLMLSHPVLYSLTLSHAVSPCLTLSHCVSYYLTLSSAVSHFLSLSNTVSPGLIQSLCFMLSHTDFRCLSSCQIWEKLWRCVFHPISPCLTMSHPVSPYLTPSHHIHPVSSSLTLTAGV